MDQVTKVRRQLKREEWKSIISECRASGMTVKAWCKDHGIIEQTYYKLIRVFYAILSNGVTYDPQKMLSDIHRPLQAA